jgi:hypothetical protein
MAAGPALPRLLVMVNGWSDESNGSDQTRRRINSFFDSGLVDHAIERLVASDAFWRLVDEIAQRPSVRAALSQQGPGFADPIRRALRDRTHKADQRVEQSTARLMHRQPRGAPPDADGPTP